MNAIKTLFSLTFKLIKWTLIIGVIGFVALFIVGLFMTNKEAFDGVTITEDHIAMVVGSSVILLGLVVVCKIGNAASESGAVGSLFNVIFLPITLPFKVLGAIASMGSGSSRSYSAPAPRSAPRSAPAPKSGGVRITKSAPREIKKRVEPKPQHGYKLTYQNITAKKGNTQTVQFLFDGGPIECAMALESGELAGQGFVPSCCQIVSLQMTH